MNELIHWSNRKAIAIAIIFLLLGLYIGFALGGYTTIKAVAGVAKGFVDEGLIKAAIYQYKNNIGLCFPSNLTL